MKNITLKNIGGWDQLILAGKYYEEKIIENGEGPSEVLVKVDYRTGSWHKPTTYYYKTSEGWAYGIMKFEEYWVIGELGFNDEHETCEMESEFGSVDVPSGECWNFLYTGHMYSYPHKARTLADVLELLGAVDEETGELMPFSTTTAYNRKIHEKAMNNWDSVLRHRNHGRIEQREEEYLQRSGNIY
jgi:hypothetical protein